jgi:hypothetical protein
VKRPLHVIPLVLVWALSFTFAALATDDQSKLPPEIRVPDGFTRVVESVGPLTGRLARWSGSLEGALTCPERSVTDMNALRADQIGSLLRPPELIEAWGQLFTGRITAAQLEAVEDRSIEAALEGQKCAGIDVYTA